MFPPFCERHGPLIVPRPPYPFPTYSLCGRLGFLGMEPSRHPGIWTCCLIALIIFVPVGRTFPGSPFLNLLSSIHGDGLRDALDPRLKRS